MYHQDKQNAEAAAEFINSEMTKAAEEIRTEASNQASVNNLLVSANSVVVSEDDGVKTLVKKWKPVIDGEMPVGLAIAIMGIFISKSHLALQYIRVKDYGNLTVKQMVAALCEAGIKVDGVQYEEVMK
jgi:hypothetical protein